MPTESGKPLIVISYAHADEPETPAEGEVKWLSFVTGYLRPAIKHGAVDLWIDRLMPGGADWEREIGEKLRACDVFILLVSRHSLSSDYVVDKEIAIIRERQAKGEAVHFYPLILTPTPKIALDLVRDKNLRPRDGKPLSDFSVNERFRHMNEAVDEIADIANAIAAKPARDGRDGRPHARGGDTGDLRRLDPSAPAKDAQPGDHDSLQRWMRRRHPDVVLTVAARAALRVTPLVYSAHKERSGAAPARELDDLLSAVLRAVAPAQLRPQFDHADEFRSAFRAAADKAEAAARRAAHATARAVCQCVSDVAAAAATRFDDQAPRAAFAADAVALAAEACARGAAEHAALIVRELSGRTDTKDLDDVGARRKRDNSARAAATAAEGSGAAALWEEVQGDLAWAEGFDPDTLAANGPKDRPLWAHGQPDWVRNVWSSFKADVSLAQQWDVWIAWYEERLRGVQRGEAYESVFASVPTEEWDKGLAAANGWIRQRLEGLRDNESPQTRARITDRDSLAAWLDTQSTDAALTIAARAALRLVPLLGSPNQEIAVKDLEDATAASLRACALARIVAKYGAGGDGSRAPASRAASTAADRIAARVIGAGARVVVKGAADAARAADASARDAAFVRAIAVDAASRAPAWDEVQMDARTIDGARAVAVVDSSLWSGGWSDPTAQAWSSLCATLPRDHDWQVWIDWYEERLRGVSRDEAYDLAFASVPQEEWDKGPAAANWWIQCRLTVQTEDKTPGKQHLIENRFSFEQWLNTQDASVGVALAVRAALRVLPMTAHAAPRRVGRTVSAAFRAVAVARVVARHPEHSNELVVEAIRARNRADSVADVGVPAGRPAQAAAANASDAAADAALSAAVMAHETGGAVGSVFADDAVTASALAPGTSVARVAARAAYYAENALSAARTGSENLTWRHIQSDVDRLQDLDIRGLIDSPLWPSGAPNWAGQALSSLRATLPDDEDWQVWHDWYGDRSRGGSRGEDSELVFARVPPDIWEQGPAAANSWIKAHLPTAPEAPRPEPLPSPLPNLDAPFAYGWSASQRVAVVAGAQNLPFYPHFSSEEDHRRALEACRLGGERLLKALRRGRYNARPEYDEALEYYLDDLPKTAGAGNILLANDQIRILHAMFLADAAMLPEGLASRLKSVIANQFALNAFYDLVQRHNEAVSAGNWAQPFPLDAAKGFFGAVEDHTPRWFEREVKEGLRQVEQAEPPAAAPVEAAPPSAIEPPPLPPGTPDAQDSWRRQMATAANALWETFLQGRDLPVAQDEWRQAADHLGEHVQPILEFLRAQEQGRG